MCTQYELISSYWLLFEQFPLIWDVFRSPRAVVEIQASFSIQDPLQWEAGPTDHTLMASSSLPSSIKH